MTGVRWVRTTRTAPWRTATIAAGPPDGEADVEVRTGDPRQAIEGFGACFNELGWDALSTLDAADRAAAAGGQPHRLRQPARVRQS